MAFIQPTDPTTRRRRIFINARIEYEPNTGCHIWTGDRTRYGHGVIRYKGRRCAAHRVLYEMEVGPITERTLDHLCRQKACVNVKHLEPVTLRENIKREGLQGWAQENEQKTHCPRGHEYDMIFSSGSRWCRTCHKATGLATYERKKARNAILASN